MKKIIILLAGIIVLDACSKNQTVTEKPIAFDTSFIDSTQDPCDNFYKYAIGSWQAENPVPETESRWMAFNILYEENRQKLIKIIDEVSNDKNAKKGSEEQMIRDFYSSGMDSAAREANGLEVIEAILNEIELAERKEDIIHLFGELAPMGIKTPVGLYIGANSKSSKENIVYASQAGLNLPDRDYYLEDKFEEDRKSYVNHINTMFKLAGLDEVPGENILQLETRLAEISWSRLERRDPVKAYNKKNLEDWDNSLSELDMAQIFETRGFGKFDSLIVSQPTFFEAFNTMMKSESIEDWKSYLKWNAISSFSSYTTYALEKEHFNFYSTKLKGTEVMKSRSERVFNTLNGTLGEPLGKLFVKEHFSEESKVYMSRMIENLRMAYKESIEDLTWMSEETKAKAIRKLESFTYKVGYPDKWEDYSKLEIVADNYAENVLSSRKFGYQDMLDKLGEPVDKEEWHMTPQMVNAYYSSSNNEIVFPAGILQPPFFHKDFDHAINYGGIGAVIGHEFSHGFDDQGSKFDWDGNLNEWWTAEDRAKFEELAKKLGEQYDTYSPMEGMNVNGQMTMGENIADLGGITLAYGALQKEFDGKEPAPIDGFTWEQRFFLGWANVWKGNIKPEEMKNRLKSDVHSPAEYRVIGPLVNFEPYEKAWGTCENKAMHKPDTAKIKIW
ncbi:MAG: M13 family metallopeptidase [Bacteroidia bacterium]|nr:M13 family metallopeptidase [Bacteroidia bacterium]